jgi:two-component system, chemotaxis family, protein-glutamate methylesterase/glutaminase
MIELIVIGASLGGVQAVSGILAGLPGNFPIPIAVVQHRHKQSDTLLAPALIAYSHLPVVEIIDKMAIAPGRVYLAPADYHALVEIGHFALSVDEPILYARPSIDVLFESASEAYGARVAGVLLTGASADGAAGMRAIKSEGGFALVQDPSTAECPVMPQAALERTKVDQILPLDAIAEALIQLSGRQ